MHLSHPLCITLCQIIVDSYDMNALSLKRIQICRKGRNQCLTFTSTHLRDTSLMQQDTTDQLHTIMLHMKNPVCCLPYHRKCFRKQIIKCLTFFKAFLKLRCLCLQLFITKCLHRRIECFNLIYNWIYFLKLFIAMCSKYFF